MSIEAMKQALEALEKLFGIPAMWTGEGGGDVAVWRLGGSYRAQQAITSLRKAIAEAEQEPKRLWLWKNFVDGRPEYWAFDNPYPCVSAQGDPLTLGEPCGWAFLKPSVNGRPDRSEQEVINTVTRLAAHGIKENT